MDCFIHVTAMPSFDDKGSVKIYDFVEDNLLPATYVPP